MQIGPPNQDPSFRDLPAVDSLLIDDASNEILLEEEIQRKINEAAMEVLARESEEITASSEKITASYKEEFIKTATVESDVSRLTSSNAYFYSFNKSATNTLTPTKKGETPDVLYDRDDDIYHAHSEETRIRLASGNCVVDSQDGRSPKRVRKVARELISKSLFNQLAHAYFKNLESKQKILEVVRGAEKVSYTFEKIAADHQKKASEDALQQQQDRHTMRLKQVHQLDIAKADKNKLHIEAAHKTWALAMESLNHRIILKAKEKELQNHEVRQVLLQERDAQVESESKHESQPSAITHQYTVTLLSINKAGKTRSTQSFHTSKDRKNMFIKMKSLMTNLDLIPHPPHQKFTKRGFFRKHNTL